jgi:DNA-binding transcriptional ArsR family regulator
VNEDLELDRIFNALSDRTRRSMIARLAKGSATVSELAEPFDISLPAISKHLKILESAGLLRREVEGRVHHCALSSKPLSEAESWLAKYDKFWSDNLDSLAEYAERNSVKNHSLTKRHKVARK